MPPMQYHRFYPVFRRGAPAIFLRNQNSPALPRFQWSDINRLSLCGIITPAAQPPHGQLLHPEPERSSASASENPFRRE